MTRYLISFDDGAMAHIPDDDLAVVGEAAHAVVRQAKDAGVWIHGGGVRQQRASSAPMVWSPRGRLLRPKPSSVVSPSFRCPRARRRSNGPRRSRSPAAALRKSGNSWMIRKPDGPATRHPNLACQARVGCSSVS